MLGSSISATLDMDYQQSFVQLHRILTIQVTTCQWDKLLWQFDHRTGGRITIWTGH